MLVKFTPQEIEKIQRLADADNAWAASLTILTGQFRNSPEAWRAVSLSGNYPMFMFEDVLDQYWSSTERQLLRFAADFAYGKSEASLYNALQHFDDRQFATLFKAMQTLRGKVRFRATDEFAGA